MTRLCEEKDHAVAEEDLLPHTYLIILPKLKSRIRLMKWMVLGLLLPLSAFATELKILTWNTFLLPPPINFSKQASRTREMVKLLPTLPHDVMVFQETFFKKKRSALIRSLSESHPYVAIPWKGRKLRHIENSGLVLLSRFPMKVLGQTIFRSCAKADCLSAKSAIIVELTLPDGKKIQLVNTHLQAWDEPKTVAVRKQQLLQIKTLMKRHEISGIPQLLVGDLNIDANYGTEYVDSLNLLEMSSIPLEGDLIFTNGFSTAGCFKNPGAEREEWLDHVWSRGNGAAVTLHSQRALELQGRLKGAHCPLSDHYAVEAQVTL